MKKTRSNIIRTLALFLVLALVAPTLFSCTALTGKEPGTTAAVTTGVPAPAPEDSFAAVTAGYALMNEIRTQYLQFFHNSAPEYADALIDARVYGKIGSLYVMHVALGELTDVRLQSEVIGNFAFLYDVDAPLYVKLGKTFLPLKDAYLQGMLSTEQLEQVYNHCHTRYQSLYEEYMRPKWLYSEENLDNPEEKKIHVILQPFAMEYSFTAEDFSSIGCIEVERPSWDTTYLIFSLSSDTELSVVDAIRSLEQRPEFYWVRPGEPGMKLEDTVPSDAYYDYQWAMESIELHRAWDYTTGSDSILVGVIDSGIDISHPDLVGKVDTNLSRSFVDGESALIDVLGHGTQVASVIAAATNNNVGIAGVCWNVKLVSLKVVPQDEDIDVSDIAEAISYAKEYGIHILNCSIGSYNPDDKDVLYPALEAYSGLFVCSAGNAGWNTDEGYDEHYPSSIELPNIISVGAHNAYTGKPSFSNYGATSVDLFAPGVSILTCIPMSLCDCPCFDSEGNRDPICADSGYHSAQGTSVAAPFVTGVAALVLSRNPLIKPEDVREIIIEAVNPHISFTNACVSGGLLNAYNAVRHDYNYTQIDDDYHYFMCDDCTYTDGVYKFEMHDYDRYTYHQTAHALACVCGGIIEFQPHSYSTEYTDEGTYHARWCICGSSLVEDHEFEYERLMNQHRRTCVCGIDVTEGHTYDYAYTREDHYTHIAECACGKFIEEPHIFEDSDICICGSFNR